jgi:hypothetical protein
MNPDLSDPRDPFALDDLTVERLARGAIAPADAPPAYKGVAELVSTLRAPATSDELADEAAARRTFATAVPVGGSRVFARHRALAAGMVAALVLGTAGVAAAATGSLPGPLQRAAATAFHDVGIHVPDDAGGHAGPASRPGSSTTSSTAGSTTSAPHHCSAQGSCTDNHGSTVCATASAGQCQQGAATCTAASDGHCRAARTEPSTPPGQQKKGTPPGQQKQGDGSSGAPHGSGPPGGSPGGHQKNGNGSPNTSTTSSTSTTLAQSTSTTTKGNGGGNGHGHNG